MHVLTLFSGSMFDYETQSPHSSLQLWSQWGCGVFLPFDLSWRAVHWLQHWVEVQLWRIRTLEPHRYPLLPLPPQIWTTWYFFRRESLTLDDQVDILGWSGWIYSKAPVFPLILQSDSGDGEGTNHLIKFNIMRNVIVARIVTYSKHYGILCHTSCEVSHLWKRISPFSLPCNGGLRVSLECTCERDWV